jgi:competence protein ComEC
MIARLLHSKIQVWSMSTTSSVMALCHFRSLPKLAVGALVTFIMLSPAWGAPAPDGNNVLRIVFVDVEGGQATLFVTPAGQSLLIDTGWPGNDGRDADRIVAAAKQAKLSKIDYVLITHFHNDQVGGLPQLVARIPVGTVIDHGDKRESTDAPTVQVWQAYQALLGTKRFKRMSVRPGDSLPIRGIQATVLSSDGAVIDRPRRAWGRGMPLARTPKNVPRTKPKTSVPSGSWLRSAS